MNHISPTELYILFGNFWPIDPHRIILWRTMSTPLQKTFSTPPPPCHFFYPLNINHLWTKAHRLLTYVYIEYKAVSAVF